MTSRAAEPPRKTLIDLGRQQREVLEILWSRGRASVREVLGILSPERRLAYTSVLSVLQKLERLGWLRHEKRGPRYLYYPARSRREAVREAVRRCIDCVGGENAADVLAEWAGPGPKNPSLTAQVDFRKSVA